MSSAAAAWAEVDRLKAVIDDRDKTIGELERAVEHMVVVLVSAKCLRWTMGTCPTRSPLDRPCLVCRTLTAAGYSPAIVTAGGLETWTKDGSS